MEQQIPFYFVVELCAMIGAVLYAVRYTRMNWKRPLDTMVRRCGVDHAQMADLPETLIHSWQNNGVSRAQLERALRYCAQDVNASPLPEAG